MVSICPFCHYNLNQGAQGIGSTMKLYDLIELIDQGAIRDVHSTVLDRATVINYRKGGQMHRENREEGENSSINY